MNRITDHQLGAIELQLSETDRRILNTLRLFSSRRE